jgi:4-diphosphocytidyl-2-C-methyl-D-erythritol kinase
MLTETAPAKINLALHVRARRPDGYHDLETLFVFARDGDRVSLADAATPTFAMTGPFAGVVGPDADNLVVRAAAAFRAAFGIARHHAITLDKHLPVASGIGGGSADAAATLRALARRHDVAVNDPRLVALAAGLGADVPACLLGRAAFGSGRGDALAPIAGLGDMPVLLVNPLVPVSTAAVFAGWDGVDRGAITGGDDTLARGIAGRNDLQPAAERVAPQVAHVLAILREQAGVVLARMSGSGATCFALFRHAADRDAAAAVAARQPDWWQLASMVA